MDYWKWKVSWGSIPFNLFYYGMLNNILLLLFFVVTASWLQKGSLKWKVSWEKFLFIHFIIEHLLTFFLILFCSNGFFGSQRRNGFKIPLKTKGKLVFFVYFIIKCLLIFVLFKNFSKNMKDRYIGPITVFVTLSGLFGLAASQDRGPSGPS